jgi:hypothetical protein
MPWLNFTGDVIGEGTTEIRLTLKCCVPVAKGGTGSTTAAGARAAFGLGSAAVLNVGQTAGTVAAGDDPRFTSSGLQPQNNLSDLDDVATARDNLALGSAALQPESAFADAIHGHVIGDVGGLQIALDGKALSVHTHVVGDTTGLQGLLDGKAPVAHIHTIANVTSLQAALDGKSPVGHQHVIGDVTNLQSTLDGKALSVHTHTSSQVTDFATAVDARIAAASLQPLDAGLTSLASKTAPALYWLSADNVWSTVTIGSGLSFTAGTLAATGGSGGITQLTGDVTAGPGSGSQAATLASVNANVGSFGSGSLVPVITVDAKGRVTAVSTAAISGGADPFVAKLRLASDVSTGANVTPVALTGMSFAFLANSTYVIDIFALVQAAVATTGHGFGMDVSVAVTALGMQTAHQLANTGTLSGGSAIADGAIVGVSSGLPTANTVVPVMGSGVLVTGANAGTCQFIFRSEVAAVVTCKEGSAIRVMKVA